MVSKFVYRKREPTISRPYDAISHTIPVNFRKNNVKWLVSSGANLSKSYVFVYKNQLRFRPWRDILIINVKFALHLIHSNHHRCYKKLINGVFGEALVFDVRVWTSINKIFVNLFGILPCKKCIIWRLMCPLLWLTWNKLK